jgi:phage tail-like protein
VPPPPTYNQLIAEIQGFGRTPLEYVDGMGGVVEVLPFKDGSDIRVRMRPGRTTWDSITLRRTQFGRPALWKWWQKTIEGGGRRREVKLRLVDQRGGPIASWTLSGCWPSRWQLVPRLNAAGQPGYVEQMTLVVEKIDLD